MPVLLPRGPPDDTTVLFLFISFAILILLALLLIVVCCQTWMLWKMAQAVVEQDARLIQYPGSKRRSVRGSVYVGRLNEEEDGREKESMMSGGLGVGESVGGTRMGRWARGKKKGLMGRWF
jgi:hypothetical protein